MAAAADNQQSSGASRKCITSVWFQLSPNYSDIEVAVARNTNPQDVRDYRTEEATYLYYQSRQNNSNTRVVGFVILIEFKIIFYKKIFVTKQNIL